MRCIDTFSKYCAILPIKGKTESNLAFGLIECINNMGGTPKTIIIDGEGAIKKSGLFQKYVMEHNIVYIPSRGHPVFAEKDDSYL